MFGNVWRWAGEIRRTERNIGVDAYRITGELRQLIEDCNFWQANTTYISDEIAARFSHRLVFIHPFPNGNGRLSRMPADLLLINLGEGRFSWGRTSLVDPNETRNRYIAALQAADQHDYGPLIKFVRL